jgi:hypothetical protein
MKPSREKETMIRRTRLYGVLLIATILCGASSVAAQSAAGIAGVVKDATGGVLPGVTVEASSPALLEKVRTAVTDGQGVYSFTDLRPGTYTVTFTLTGFNAIRRDGIELTTSFTATVNVEMAAGNIQETITVSGQASTVDVTNVVQQKAFTRETLEALPVGSKSWSAVAVLVPGVRLTGAQNVGGTGASNATAAIHGGAGAEAIMLLDGMRYNQGNGFGGVRNAYNENDGSVEEITFQTAALTAEIETGSFVRNIVPKEGGNQFKAFFGTSFTNHALENNNMDAALAARGIPSVNFVDLIYDYNPAVGGPILKDKLWFYSAFRAWGVNQGIAGTYFNATPNGRLYTPDLNRPALSTSTKGSENTRLTWLASPRNKIGFYYEYQQNWERFSYGQGSLGSGGTTAPEAIGSYEVEPNYWVQMHWTSTVTSKLLVEAGGILANTDFQTVPQPGNDPSTPGIRELSTGTVWRNLAGTFGHNAAHQYNFSGSVSYVTGSHTFKTGALLLRANAHTTRDVTGGGTVLQVLNGVPSSVQVNATPFSLDEKIDAQLGVYAQDQWKVKRATMYLGGRFDLYKASVPGQTIGPGPWTPTRNLSFAEAPNVPDWKDFMPRLGVSYDLFGNGKTALKGTFNKYVFGPDLVVFTRLANPIGAIATNATRTWTDRNNDFVPQLDELGALSATTFGLPVITTRYDPDTLNGWGKRGYNWEASASIQHELLPRVGISAGYYRRWWGNLLVSQNTAVSATDFSQYCLTSPTESRLPDGGGNQLCGLYDVSQAKFGLTNTQITFVDKLGGSESKVYDGLDLSVNVRLPGGALFAGGSNSERTRDNFCYAAGDPTIGLVSVSPGADGGRFQTGSPRTSAYCDVRPPLLTQYKFYGSYPIPFWGLSASATFQSTPGPEILASYTAANSLIAPALGRPVSNGVNGTTTIALVPNGTLYGDRLNQTDFRLAKTVSVPHGPRMQLQFDIYNLFNGNPVISMNNTFGSAWQRPTVVQVGRLFKFGAQLNF